MEGLYRLVFKPGETLEGMAQLPGAVRVLYFDGFDFDQGFLLETKGLGYDKHIGVNLEAKKYFQGAKRLVNQARRQLKVAGGVPIRWYVAEPRMVAILQKLFARERVKGIDVIYTPP